MEEAQLVRRGGPDFLQGIRIQGRAVGYDLLRLYPRILEAREEVLHVLAFDLSVDQLVAHKAVAARSRRIDGQQQCQLVLVDLVHTQDAGELLHHPSLVISGEIQLVGELPAPAADHCLARGNPEVPGEPPRHPPEGHPVLVDRENRLLSHPLGVETAFLRKNGGWARKYPEQVQQR